MTHRSISLYLSDNLNNPPSTYDPKTGPSMLDDFKIARDEKNKLFYVMIKSDEPQRIIGKYIFLNSNHYKFFRRCWLEQLEEKDAILE